MRRPAQRTKVAADRSRPGDSVEAVYRCLGDLILNGELRPNERLIHGELSERLDVGRTPIRQALHRLEADGLVVSTPNRGFRVAPVAVAHVEELYAARVLLEPPLMATAVAQMKPHEFVQMHEQWDRMHANRERILDFQVAHRDFHLVAASDYSSTFITDLVVRVHRHLFRHQQLYMSRPRVPEDVLTVDRYLLAALESGDAAAARHIYEFHLIDMAIGMVLDVDPDHEFDVLLRVAEANDIIIDADPRIRRRPATLTWKRLAIALPPLQTSNLVYEPRPLA